MCRRIVTEFGRSGDSSAAAADALADTIVGGRDHARIISSSQSYGYQTVNILSHDCLAATHDGISLGLSL